MENHSNINNMFIPYELSLKLKELGFNDECFGAYHNANNLDLWSDDYDYSYAVKAPLWQQAFDWFRDEHNIYFTVDYGINFVDNSKYWYFDKGYPNNTEYKTYEEARLGCLKKLIEIVEKDKHNG